MSLQIMLLFVQTPAVAPRNLRSPGSTGHLGARHTRQAPAPRPSHGLFLWSEGALFPTRFPRVCPDAAFWVPSSGPGGEAAPSTCWKNQEGVPLA